MQNIVVTTGNGNGDDNYSSVYLNTLYLLVLEEACVTPMGA
jgi:hypothetical protein